MHIQPIMYRVAYISFSLFFQLIWGVGEGDWVYWGVRRFLVSPLMYQFTEDTGGWGRETGFIGGLKDSWFPPLCINSLRTQRVI